MQWCFPVFSCPVESTPVGPNKGTDFIVGHYAVNSLFVGHTSTPGGTRKDGTVAKSPAPEPYRTESQVEDASVVVFITDNSKKEVSTISAVNNLSGDTIALRHGGGGTIEETATEKFYRNGKGVNIGYYDGHAAMLPREGLLYKGSIKRYILIDGYTTNWGY